MLCKSLCSKHTDIPHRRSPWQPHREVQEGGDSPFFTPCRTNLEPVGNLQVQTTFSAASLLNLESDEKDRNQPTSNFSPLGSSFLFFSIGQHPYLHVKRQPLRQGEEGLTGARARFTATSVFLLSLILF